MTERWGRFTVRGSETLEVKIEEMVNEIRDRVRRTVDPAHCRALLMIGGYGRGEGGVVVRDGIEMPHNNFDFILFTQDLPLHIIEQKKQEIDREMVDFSGKNHVDIDISILDIHALTKCDGRIMWFDMRYGHKLIFGDDSFVVNNNKFSLAGIPPWDARNLLVNRGTLMIINELLLEQDSDARNRNTIIKHSVKAIIGYGDALLYFLGNYHWSYVEKQQLMRRQEGIDDGFRDLYDRAMEFRFQPDYQHFLKSDLRSWMDELRTSFNRIHLKCESLRLNHPTITWEEYPEAAFRHAVFEDVTKSRAIAKKLINLIKTKNHDIGSSMLSKIGARILGEAGMLPLVFPVIAYHLDSPSFVDTARKVLGSERSCGRDLRKAYLSLWGKHNDINFRNRLAEFQIDLDCTGDLS